jgi:hypothetical protein
MFAFVQCLYVFALVVRKCVKRVCLIAFLMLLVRKKIKEIEKKRIGLQRLSSLSTNNGVCFQYFFGSLLQIKLC